MGRNMAVTFAPATFHAPAKAEAEAKHHKPANNKTQTANQLTVGASAAAPTTTTATTTAAQQPTARLSKRKTRTKQNQVRAPTLSPAQISLLVAVLLLAGFGFFAG